MQLESKRILGSFPKRSPSVTWYWYLQPKLARPASSLGVLFLVLGKFHGIASPDDSFPVYHTVVFSAVEWDVKAIGGCEGLWLSLNEKKEPIATFSILSIS